MEMNTRSDFTNVRAMKEGYSGMGTEGGQVGGARRRGVPQFSRLWVGIEVETCHRELMHVKKQINGTLSEGWYLISDTNTRQSAR
jgi:hypothetical protein